MWLFDFNHATQFFFSYKLRAVSTIAEVKYVQMNCWLVFVTAFRFSRDRRPFKLAAYYQTAVYQQSLLHKLKTPQLLGLTGAKILAVDQSNVQSVMLIN